VARKTLPTIETKEKIVNRRIRLSERLNSDITAFAAFYEAEKGNKPDENAVIVAILQDYFDANNEFKKFKKSQNNSEPNNVTTTEKVKPVSKAVA